MIDKTTLKFYNMISYQENMLQISSILHNTLNDTMQDRGFISANNKPVLVRFLN